MAIESANASSSLSTLSFVDWTILSVYFIFVIGIGFLIKRKVKTSNDFLMSGRSIPLWITSLAFISANLGAQEVLGMAASGAKYGMMTSHFYWIAALPAMLFLGLFMMPFYYGSKARSVPEYLVLRFDEKTRAFNALSFAAMTLFSSGISLYALAILLQTLLGWSFDFSVWLAALIVMGYTWLGGLTSAVYNEVLQFFLIVLGIAPLSFLGLKNLGGWDGLKSQLESKQYRIWEGLSHPSLNLMGVEFWGLVFGLAFVLSFGYWCTDFLVVQRAMIARNQKDASRTPIIAAVPKLFLPLIVIIPGLIAVALEHAGTGFTLPLKPDGRTDFDMTLPSLLLYYYPSGLLGVGITALMASFMSGMAGNVTAFNTVFTFDLYQAYIKKNGDDKHYLRVGKMTTLVGVLLSILTAYVARSFNNIMDFLQLIFGFVNAPLFATFLLGMFWKRATGHGAFFGLVSGTVAASFTHGLTVAEGKGGWLGHTLFTFPSSMGQAFWIAIVAWTTCFSVTFFVSLFTKPKPGSALVGLVYSMTPRTKDKTKGPVWLEPKWLAILVVVLAACMNWFFR